MRTFITVVLGKKDVEGRNIEPSEKHDLSKRLLEIDKNVSLINVLLETTYHLIEQGREVQIRITNLPPRKDDTRTY